MLFLGLGILVHWKLEAQLISVKTIPEKDSLMIGERMLLTIKVDVAEDIPFHMPELKDSLGAHLEIYDFKGADTTRVNGRIQVDHNYLFTGFEDGSQHIPPCL